MSDFLPISGAVESAFAADPSARVGAASSSRIRASAAADAEVARASDAVELSDHALFLARLHELPEVRDELIERARASIESGAYDTDAVIDETIDRLAQDLDLEA